MTLRCTMKKLNDYKKKRNMENDFPVDMVYLWCDEGDPEQKKGALRLLFGWLFL